MKKLLTYAEFLNEEEKNSSVDFVTGEWLGEWCSRIEKDKDVAEDLEGLLEAIVKHNKAKNAIVIEYESDYGKIIVNPYREELKKKSLKTFKVLFNDNNLEYASSFKLYKIPYGMCVPLNDMTLVVCDHKDINKFKYTEHLKFSDCTLHWINDNILPKYYHLMPMTDDIKNKLKMKMAKLKFDI